MKSFVAAIFKPANNKYDVNTFSHQLDSAKRLESVA